MFYINLTVTTDFFYYLSDEKAWHMYYMKEWATAKRYYSVLASFSMMMAWWYTVEMVYNMEWYEYIRKVFSVKGTIIRISLKFCLLARAFDYNKIILLCSWIKFYLYGKMFFFIDREQENGGREMRELLGWNFFDFILSTILCSRLFVMCYLNRPNINWSTWILLNFVPLVEQWISKFFNKNCAWLYPLTIEIETKGCF